MATFFVHCGTAWLTQLMNATITVTTYFVGWGEGSTAAASKGSTQISSEVQARNSAANSITDFNQKQWISVLTATSVRSVNNAGLFHNNSGTLLIHGDFSTIALAANDRIEFTVTLTST
jgi:hypothetical protein